MSALNFIFAAHGIILAAIALQLLFLPAVANFLFIKPLDLTHLFIARLYGAALMSLGIISLLCRDMPNMLPCKRAAAAGFMIFHGIIAVFVFQSREEGIFPLTTSYGIAAFHGLQAFVLYAWYTATAAQVKAFLKQTKGEEENKKKK
ncbi:hypothetical protein K501DRAFT_223222 [Backusella circina FSU 941]|nr:hypothetical protein K501DRAFT_223222 [Backusella circina FSU 941]